MQPDTEEKKLAAEEAEKDALLAEKDAEEKVAVAKEDAETAEAEEIEETDAELEADEEYEDDDEEYEDDDEYEDDEEEEAAPESWEEQQKRYPYGDGFTDKSLRGMWFDFHGRLNRMRYFMRALPVYLLLGAVSAMSGSFPWLAIVYIPLFISLVSLMTRRAHDMNYRPYLLLFMFLAPFWAVLAYLFTGNAIFAVFILPMNLLAFFTSVYFLIMKGTKGPNKFGLDPLEYPYDR